VLHLSVESTIIASLITGGIIIIIAWVMKEAYRISQKQELMV